MTVLARVVRATPFRPAGEAWDVIVALLAPDGGAARAELMKVAGVATSLIAAETPKDDKIVVWGGGPRVRVSCVYGDDAITGDYANETKLARSPTGGDWRMSLPCPEEDLTWVQAALDKKSKHYEIPDTGNPTGWTETDPEIHYDKAVAANKAYDGEWKGIVRMAKKWNAHEGKPVKPSFLIEVMALDLLVPPNGGYMRYELKGLFAAMADRIHDTWPEPAGLGPPVSDMMDATARDKAKAALRKAQAAAAAAAIQLEKQGKNCDALKAWRALFGPMFPLS
jgi:hypothetical protein